MAKKVQLLTTDLKQEVLHPETTSDMVQHGGSTLDVELGKKFDKTGGTITGDVTINQGLSVGGKIETKGRVITEELFYSTLDVELGKKFDKTGGTITGDVTINQGLSVGGKIETKGRVITEELFYALNAAGLGAIVAKIATHGGVDLGDSNVVTAICSSGTPKYYDGNFRYDIHNDKDHPIQSGDWSPQFTAQNGGTVTYTSRDGKYSRYGNMVIVTFNIIARNPVNFNGQLHVTNLPFVNQTGTHVGCTLFAIRGFNVIVTFNIIARNPVNFNGQLHVTNLPFVNQTGTHVGCTLFAIRGFNVGSEANNRQICAYIRPGESRITFNYSDTTATTSNIAVLTHSQLITTNQIEISATVVYKIS